MSAPRAHKTKIHLCLTASSGASASASLLLLSLPLTMLPTHSVGASGSRSAVTLPFVCWCLLVVLPPVVLRRIHLPLLPCLHLLSHLCLVWHPSCLVGCHISQHLSLSLLSRLRPVPWPPPFITPQPFVVPLAQRLNPHLLATPPGASASASC